MSQSSTRLPLYCQIAIRNIWLGACIAIHFILKIEEREDLNKYACWLLSDSELLDNNGDQLWVYTSQTDRKSGLSLRGNNGGLLPYK